MANPTTVPAYSGVPVVQTLPTNTLLDGVMSNTSSAPDCFISQRFSAQLQAFMISYANMVQSQYAIYGV